MDPAGSTLQARQHVLLSWPQTNCTVLGWEHDKHDTTKQDAVRMVSDLRLCQALQAVEP